MARTLVWGTLAFDGCHILGVGGFINPRTKEVAKMQLQIFQRMENLVEFIPRFCRFPPKRPKRFLKLIISSCKSVKIPIESKWKIILGQISFGYFMFQEIIGILVCSICRTSKINSSIGFRTYINNFGILPFYGTTQQLHSVCHRMWQ